MSFRLVGFEGHSCVSGAGGGVTALFMQLQLWMSNADMMKGKCACINVGVSHVTPAEQHKTNVLTKQELMNL